MSGRRSDAGFEALFHAGFDRCVAVARRVVRDTAVAEELAAEASARAWARWPRLAGDASALGWVLRVTTNLAIDVTRRRPLPSPVLADALGPEDLSAMHLALVAALRTLPRRQREAIVLRYLADLSEPDVATALGVSAGSVKTHLHRGIARLRDVLGESDDAHVEGRLATGS